MPITIEVIAPGTGARTELVSIGKEIDKTTGKAKGLGDALGTAARQGSTSTQKAKTDFSQLGAVFKTTSAAFAPFVNEFQRQKDILEEIQGPMAKHLADLRSLDQLYKRGAVGADEYAAAHKRMTSELSKAQGERTGKSSSSISSSKTDIEGTLKDVAGGVGAGDIFGAVTGGAGAVAAGLAGAAVAAVALHDAYATLNNSALGLVSSTGSVNTVIGQQIALAGQLHGKTEEAIALTMKASAGNDQFNLTQRQLADLTKEVGQIVQLSGHQLSDATGFMEQLTAAFDDGRLSGNQLRAMFREFPAFADMLSKSTGRSAKDLQAMADEGKLVPQQILTAFQKSGADIDKDFGKHIDSISSKWSRFKDELSNGVASGKLQLTTGSQIDALINDPSGTLANAKKGFLNLASGLTGVDVSDHSGEELAKRTKDIDDYNEKIDKASNAEQKFYEQLGKVSQELRDQSGFYKGVSDAITAHAQAVTQATYQQDAAVGVLVANLTNMNSVLTGASADQIKNLRGTFSNDLVRDVRGLQDATLGVTKETVSYGAAVADAKTNTNQHKRGIEDITAAYKAGAVTSKEYSDQMRNLSEDFAFAYGVIHNITQPTHEWELSLSTLGVAVGRGTISLHEFNEALQKLHDQPVDVDQLNALRDALGVQSQFRERLPSFVGTNNKLGLLGSYERAPLPTLSTEGPKPVFDGDNAEAQLPGGAVASSNHFLTDISNAAKAYYQIVGDLRTNAEKYAFESGVIAQAPANALTDADKAKALLNLKDKYVTILTPLEQYEKGVRQVREEEALGKGSAEAYTQALLDLRLQFGQGTVTDGLVKGLQQVRKEGTDVANTLASELTDAFKTVNDSLTDLIVTGTADWHKMVDALQRELVGNLLKTIEGGVINLIMPQTQAATAGVTTGTSASTTMLAAAPGIGTAIGSAAAAAMAAGGAASSAASSVLPGLASAAASGAGGSAAGSAFTDALGGAGVPGFAGGGSFVAGGDGGRDTTPVHFMATRGERVTIETPSQQRDRGGGAPVSVRVINVSNPREQTLAAMNTREGEKLVMTTSLNNRKTLRGHIQK
jgi:tape measure domain-containing protein